jgi:hypothetical protein
MEPKYDHKKERVLEAIGISGARAEYLCKLGFDVYSELHEESRKDGFTPISRMIEFLENEKTLEPREKLFLAWTLGAVTEQENIASALGAAVVESLKEELVVRVLRPDIIKTPTEKRRETKETNETQKRKDN